jgi:hypothetical protein
VVLFFRRTKRLGPVAPHNPVTPRWLTVVVVPLTPAARSYSSLCGRAVALRFDGAMEPAARSWLLIDPAMMLAWAPEGGLWPEMVLGATSLFELTTKAASAVPPPSTRNRQMVDITLA